MRLAISLLLGVGSAFGADLTGMWIGQIERGNNPPIDIAFQFVQTGSTLTGKLYGDYGSTAISEAKLESDAISFIVLTSEQSGNEINEVRLSFTGTLKDGALSLTRERLSSRNTGNKGEARVRPNAANTPNPPIVLKRLL